MAKKSFSESFLSAFEPAFRTSLQSALGERREERAAVKGERRAERAEARTERRGERTARLRAELATTVAEEKEMREAGLDPADPTSPQKLLQIKELERFNEQAEKALDKDLINAQIIAKQNASKQLKFNRVGDAFQALTLGRQAALTDPNVRADLAALGRLFEEAVADATGITIPTKDGAVFIRGPVSVKSIQELQDVFDENRPITGTVQILGETLTIKAKNKREAFSQAADLELLILEEREEAKGKRRKREPALERAGRAIQRLGTPERAFGRLRRAFSAAEKKALEKREARAVKTERRRRGLPRITPEEELPLFKRTLKGIPELFGTIPLALGFTPEGTREAEVPEIERTFPPRTLEIETP